MDIDEDNIAYSQQKLSTLINKMKSKEKGIVEFLETSDLPSIQDFNEGLEWFNVSEPLSFDYHLKRKIVVLDFFTYCCINCMHILPDLKEIEQAFPVENGLVVVGVHSAKFANEKISSNILAAVQRYNIEHPVVNDYNSDMWKKCDVHCWPTLLVLGPDAKPLLMLMGEGHKQELYDFIDVALQFYKKKNMISNQKLPFKSAFHLLPITKGPLLFPGKITYFENKNVKLIAISDTGNNRILILRNDGSLMHIIGGNKAGYKEGTFKDAEFNAPQGLVFANENELYIADTYNHAIRLANLLHKSVKTVAGNGNQGSDHSGGNMGTFQEISSPWDVCVFHTHDLNDTSNTTNIKDILIIATAGTHQIWALFLHDVIWWKSKKYKAGTCVSIAGSGKEENRNNQYPHAAAFAQPSGLALSHIRKELYIADSESSSVRKLCLLTGKVSAVVGADRNPSNLFSFGDKDGILYDAKLQHLLGLSLSNDENTLLVADTYNHKIKIVDLSKNAIKTVCGPIIGKDNTGETMTLKEPGGLCFDAQGLLYIADTNNHAIRVVRLSEGCAVENVDVLTIKVDDSDTFEELDDSKYEIVENKPIFLSNNGAKLILNIKLLFINGISLTEQAPQKWHVALPNVLWNSIPNTSSNVENVDLVVNIPPSDKKEQVLKVIFNIVTCTTHTCTPKNFILKQPIKFENSSETNLETLIEITITPTNITV